MYHFQYISKNEIASLKNQVIELIELVQDEIRNFFTFQYEFIGSVKLNMVTCDVKSNIGFDFDVNIMVNDDDEEYSAIQIWKQYLLQCLMEPPKRKMLETLLRACGTMLFMKNGIVKQTNPKLPI
mgnify:FL=1